MSVWGRGEAITWKAIEREVAEGKWLDLGAGDGRYLPQLLEKVDQLVLADIDPKEIDKAQRILTAKQKEKILIEVFDMTKPFPFENSAFGGIFCTGTLHLFTRDKLKLIFKEITRVLKPKGKLVFDFATEVKRIGPDGKKVVLTDRPDYSLVWKKDDVKRMLKEMLKEFNLKFSESTFTDNLTNEPGYGFVTEGNFFLVIGKKK